MSRGDSRRRGRTHEPRNARRRTGGSRWRLAAILGLAFCAALVVSSLRLEIFRLRYGLAEALRDEQALIERRNGLELEVARLRDPHRLRRLAAERGFGLPERVIQLRPEIAPQGADR